MVIPTFRNIRYVRGWPLIFKVIPYSILILYTASTYGTLYTRRNFRKLVLLLNLQKKNFSFLDVSVCPRIHTDIQLVSLRANILQASCKMFDFHSKTTRQASTTRRITKSISGSIETISFTYIIMSMIVKLANMRNDISLFWINKLNACKKAAELKIAS